MSIRERRRARIDGAPWPDAPFNPTLVVANATPTEVGLTSRYVEVKEKDLIMSSKGAPALPERPDEDLDKLIDNPSYGPEYQVIYSITRKNGNTWPGVRQFRGPLIGSKDVARMTSELVAGGGVFKVEVLYDVENGNKKRLLPCWIEAFDGPPLAGEPFKSLSLGWDGGEESGTGQWISISRPGQQQTSAPQSSVFGAPSGQLGGGFGGAMPAGMGWQQPVRDGQGRILAPPPSLGLPASVRTASIEHQWLAAQDMWAHKLGFRPSLEPVDIAMKWNESRSLDQDRALANVARLEERVESQRDRNTQALEAERRRNAELEKRIAENERKTDAMLAEARQATRDAAFNAQIDSLKMQISAKPTEAARGPLADLAPFVPVLASLVTVWGANQQAHAQAQQNTLMLMLKKDPPAPLPPPPPTLGEQIAPVLAAASPFLVPVFTQWMRNQSPEAQAALREQAQLGGQGMIQMMMEFIKFTSQGDPEPPWWQEPLMNAISMASGGLNAMMLSAANNRPPMLPADQQPKQPATVQAEVVDARSAKKKPAVVTEAPVDQVPIVAPIADLENVLAKMGEVDAIASQQSLFVMREIAVMSQQGRLDARLVTHEWASILFAIHQTQPAKNDVRELAVRVADHFEHCRTFSLLPENFGAIFEKPQEALWEFMHRMPLAIVDQARAQEITTAIAQEISLREAERKKALSESDDESGETAIDGEEDGDEDDDETDDEDEETGT